MLVLFKFKTHHLLIMITSMSRDVPLEKYFPQSKSISKETRESKKVIKFEVPIIETSDDQLDSNLNQMELLDDPMEGMRLLINSFKVFPLYLTFCYCKLYRSH